MLVLCIALAFASFAFTSEESVKIFGVNIFVVEEDGVSTVPKGSAVIVNPCAAYEVSAGKLLMYKNNEKLSLGYGKDFSVLDGVYQITVIEKGEELLISENDLIGKADFCSEFLGKTIMFVKSPLGVLCLAILPCVILIIYDIIRAAAARRPLPEVIPQVKNKSAEPQRSTRGISVSSDGKGTYCRTKPDKPAAIADEILFTYTAKQKRPERKETPIIPLTDRTKPEPPAKPKNAGALRPDIPAGNTGKYEDISSRKSKPEADVSGKTAEIEKLPKADQSDAFFAQSTVPQIQKSAYFRTLRKNNGENQKNDETDEIIRPQKTSSKRSTEIIANKRVEDLMKDDDDIRDKSRYNDIDEIISGLNKKV